MRILVVDDDKLFLKQMGDVLNGVGHEVVLASSGQEALGIAARFSVDVVLLDIVMPGMMGTEVCKKLRELSNTASVPIILISSAYAEMAMQGMADEYLADDFIRKPVDPWALLRKVEALQGVPSRFAKQRV
jgi:CheY-like chemotaxis protein